MRFLIDTGFFFALASKKDPDHECARAVWEGLRGERLAHLCLTTNHIVSEAITLTRYKVSHQAAVRMGEELYSERLARIYWTSPEEEKQAFAYLTRHQDQDYSAVDCLSFVVMEKLELREALTIDGHFKHRFVALPGPRPK